MKNQREKDDKGSQWYTAEECSRESVGSISEVKIALTPSERRWLLETGEIQKVINGVPTLITM